MIVLMATGTLPILDWNWANGFRPCRPTSPSKFQSAARRKSVPGAVLAALLLFVITFVINSCCGTRPSAAPG